MTVERVLERVNCVVEAVGLYEQPKWTKETNKGTHVPVVVKAKVRLSTGGLGYVQTRVGQRITPREDGSVRFETARTDDKPWVDDTGKLLIQVGDILEMVGSVIGQVSQHGNPYKTIARATILHQSRPG